MTNFGKGLPTLDEDGKWVPPPRAHLHPADAVRMVVALTEPDGRQLAAWIQRHGWATQRVDPEVALAIAAEQRARSRLVSWLRSGDLVAFTSERIDISADVWIRNADPKAANMWWPVDAPGQGCWFVAEAQLAPLLAPFAPISGSRKLTPLRGANLVALANDVGKDFKNGQQGEFVSKFKEVSEDKGYSVSVTEARKQSVRLGITGAPGRPRKN